MQEVLLLIKLFIHKFILFRGMPVIYISGAISDASEEERGLFERAERMLSDRYVVINPMKLHWDVNSKSWYHYMRIDLVAMLLMIRPKDIDDKNGSHVLMLPTWIRSKGARIERAIADTLGIPTVDLDIDDLYNFEFANAVFR